MAKVQSVEPNIADLANGWLKSYKLPYKLEQESLNTEIDVHAFLSISFIMYHINVCFQNHIP